jgi:hypothetical protein
VVARETVRRDRGSKAGRGGLEGKGVQGRKGFVRFIRKPKKTIRKPLENH